FFLLMLRRPLRPTLFPYTTLFRSMTSPVLENDLAAAIRSIPDYPKPGIVFRDITTLLGNARAFRRAVDELVQPWAGAKIDKVAGDRKSTRLNSSHVEISYAVFCLK